MRRHAVTFSMRTFFPTATAGVLLVCLTLVGCGEIDPPYSNLVKYTLRTDPIVMSDKLGDERYTPDRPGQLPLASISDFFDPGHPLYPKKDEWFTKELMRDPKAVPAEQRQELDDWLTALFGTPALPTVEGISEAQREALKLDSRTLERGSALYRVHCLHCHGVTGDGRGPTAKWINPHPRDYRQGLFKFQSVDQTEAPRPPRRADLHRVIKLGIEGTAMPSFALLGDGNIDLMVSYVIHLSMRGKVEYDTFRSNFDYGEQNEKKWTRDLEKTQYAVLLTKNQGNDWMDAQQREIKIAPYPYKDSDTEGIKKSVARGQSLFLGIGEEGKKFNCVSCHTDYGRQAKYRFDAWGTLVRPNNLTDGIYRGGRRTIDIYYRVHSGINGSGMAVFGKGTSPETIWDLVNFVQTLPYPSMRKARDLNID